MTLPLHAELKSEFQGLWRGMLECYLLFLRVCISLRGSNFPSCAIKDAFKRGNSVNLALWQRRSRENTAVLHFSSVGMDFFICIEKTFDRTFLLF